MSLPLGLQSHWERTVHQRGQHLISSSFVVRPLTQCPSNCCPRLDPKREAVATIATHAVITQGAVFPVQDATLPI